MAYRGQMADHGARPVIRRWIAYLGGALVCVVAILGAHHAGAQATRRKALAGREKALQKTVGLETAAAVAARARAAVHEIAAQEASGRATKRMKAIARTEPELSEVVSALNTRPKPGRKRRGRT